MSFRLDRVNLWAGEVPDQAGGAAGKLAFLAQAGANLEYVFTKRLQDQPGNGILYVSPITGKTEPFPSPYYWLAPGQGVLLRVEISTPPIRQ